MPLGKKIQTLSTRSTNRETLSPLLLLSHEHVTIPLFSIAGACFLYYRTGVTMLTIYYSGYRDEHIDASERARLAPCRRYHHERDSRLLSDVFQVIFIIIVALVALLVISPSGRWG